MRARKSCGVLAAAGVDGERGHAHAAGVGQPQLRTGVRRSLCSMTRIRSARQVEQVGNLGRPRQPRPLARLVAASMAGPRVVGDQAGSTSANPPGSADPTEHDRRWHDSCARHQTARARRGESKCQQSSAANTTSDHCAALLQRLEVAVAGRWPPCVRRAWSRPS